MSSRVYKHGTFTAPGSFSETVEYLVVAGGGGGSADDATGGGGGAGLHIEQELPVQFLDHPRQLFKLVTMAAHADGANGTRRCICR